ncbi:hypothetical protein TIFTF001_017532 [Ficus carica]|uniref:Uncharacterized protein n=1 Tax=Ficus carica TaxID=3494 RepID=A0AA88ALC2_FICCA|nr:hypothetical protein TIFTF001_017532 [Ficus carica]
MFDATSLSPPMIVMLEVAATSPVASSSSLAVSSSQVVSSSRFIRWISGLPTVLSLTVVGLVFFSDDS